MENLKNKLSKKKKSGSNPSVYNLSKMYEQEQKIKLNTLTKYKGTAIYPDFNVTENELYAQEK